MKTIIYSEALKLKKLGTVRIVLIVPLVATLIALLVGGTQIFSTFSIYWWEACFLFLLIGLLFIYDDRMEERAGDFQNINHLQLGWKIYLAKIFLIFVRLLFASIVFITLLYIVSMVYQGIIIIDLVKVSMTLFLILFASFWNVPVLYILSKKMNSYVLIGLNTLVCLLIAPLLAQTKVWFLFPYTYHYKIAASLLRIKPAGDLMTDHVALNPLEIFFPILLPIVLTVLFLYLLKGVVNDAKK